MSAGSFNDGDPVWAKMGSYRFWPGKIASKYEWKKPIKAGLVCVYFFGTHNMGLALVDRVVHARSYVEVAPKKPIKACPKFTLAVKELEDYSNKWTTNKKVGKVPPTSREASLVDEPAKQHNPVTPQRSSSMKESPMFRLFCNGKLAARQVKRKEISLPELASIERAEAEFEALVLGHELSPSSPVQTILTDQLDFSFNEATSRQRNVTDEPVAKKFKLPPVGFIGLDNVSSRIMKMLVDKEMNVFVSQVDDVGIQKAVHTTTQTVFSTCDLIFIGVKNKQLLSRLFLSEWDSSHLERISKSTSLVMTSKISPQMSLEIERKIQDRGGRFLDVKVVDMADNHPIVLAGGNKTLFEECRRKYFSLFATDCKFFDKRQSVVLYSVLQFLFCISIINLAEVRTFLTKLKVPEDKFVDVFKLTQLHSSAGMQFLDSTLKTPTEVKLEDLLADVLIAKDYCDTEMQPVPLISAVVQLLKGFVSDGFGGLKFDQLDERLFNS